MSTGHTISDFHVGQKVVFGRGNGEQTGGTVMKVNRKKLKVRQDEARGSQKNHRVGTVWTVPPSLVRPVGEAPRNATPAPRRQPALPRAAFNVGDRVEFDAKGRTITGTVKRVNRKTCSVNPDGETNGRYWRVSPGILRPAGCHEREQGRPVLVNVLTGERTVGRPGMSEDLLFGLMANGMLD